jgi:glycogen operon protein
MATYSASAAAESSNVTAQYSSLPYPLGPTFICGGTNFSVFSSHATRVTLVLFDDQDNVLSSRLITLDPTLNRTSHYWHIFVSGVMPGQLYGYRVDGPQDPQNGQRFDPDKILLDPYAKSVHVGRDYSREKASRPGDNAATSMKSVVANLDTFDWEGDEPLDHSFRKTIIYEMHVAGFTLHPSSGVKIENRGTYLGVIEKIPYLQELGVTAVELMPVFQFDAQDAPIGLSNYWGYSPVSFFAPHLGYSTRPDPLACLDEFRAMVKALHQVGIEVILDVVYNHTAEGDELGPTLCFRGLENSYYYILNSNKATYANYAGAGNTLKANHSIVKRLIIDSLRYWISEMHVDGFRFDLASILSRNESGEPMANPPILWDIDSDPVLASTKLLTGAWDVGGLYQVGSFGGDRWKEWNGKFRDDIRGFLKGDRNTVNKLRDRVTGSLDLYGSGNRPAGQSINFATCHDGFTLNDLVSYDGKHNEANHQLNSDGTNANLSWNCGSEGHSTDSGVERLRKQQVKNFLALTLLSIGTPMLLMGDEMRRTQLGNNNAYCQNNEMSWLDWGLCKVNADLIRFVQQMNRSRLNFSEGSDVGGLSLEEYLTRARIEWHGIELGRPDWGLDSHSIALTLQSPTLNQVRYVAINSYWQVLAFTLPQVMGDSGRGWLRLMDTSLECPNDLVSQDQGVPVEGAKYLVNPRSIIMLHYDSSNTLKP